MAFKREREISFPLVSKAFLFHLAIHGSYLEMKNVTGTLKNPLYFSGTSSIIKRAVSWLDLQKDI